MDLATMKLAILQNSDVMEKNQYRIRIQRPKISKDLLVSFNAQKKGQILLPCVINVLKIAGVPPNVSQYQVKGKSVIKGLIIL